MLPRNLVDHMNGAAIGYAGTRDGNLVPHVHHLSGWKLEPDGDTMTCLVPEEFMPDLVESLEGNGQIAVTLSAPIKGLEAADRSEALLASHECYQYKGEYVGSRSVEDHDIEVCRQVTDRALKILPLFGIPEEAIGKLFAKPCLALSFTVREAFEQTPGPGAGGRVFPEVE